MDRPLLRQPKRSRVPWQALADEQLRTDIVSGFHALDPALRALLTDAPSGAPALVTGDMGRCDPPTSDCPGCPG